MPITMAKKRGRAIKPKTKASTNTAIVRRQKPPYCIPLDIKLPPPILSMYYLFFF
jgi:hypothetical protein